MFLPKSQLLILAVCRFCQPFAIASAFAFLPEYVEHLGVETQQVATWIGILAATFNIGECLSAFPCSYLSDRIGRKPVLLVTLTLGAFANTFFGFINSTPLALICILLTGLSNGNVAVMRTAVAELVPDRSLQAKAFSYLPLANGLGTILGPIVGGMLAKPTQRFAGIFNNSVLLETYPFALPTMVSGLLFVPAIMVAFLKLEETSRSYTLLVSSGDDKEYHDDSSDVELTKYADGTVDDSSSSLEEPDQETSSSNKPPSASAWSILLNVPIIINAVTGLHATAFDHMLPVFLHYPADSSRYVSLLNFSQGLGKDSRFIGTLLTVAGIVGMLATITVVPKLIKKLGDVGTLRLTMTLFPFIYTVFPWTSILPMQAVKIIGLGSLTLIKVVISVCASQSCLILITNSVSAQDLAKGHGVNFAIASVSRGLGSLSSGFLFSEGAKRGYMILPFWVLTAWAVVSLSLSFWTRTN